MSCPKGFMKTEKSESIPNLLRCPKTNILKDSKDSEASSRSADLSIYAYDHPKFEVNLGLPQGELGAMAQWGL